MVDSRSLVRQPKPKNLLGRLRAGRSAEERAFPTLSFDQYLELFQFNGQTTPFLGGGTLTQRETELPDSFRGAVEQAYKSNGIVYATIACRMYLFSEARFQFRRMVSGRPTDLFGGPELKILEEPWPNGNTSDLLKRMSTDADIEGNFFAARKPVAPGVVRLQRLTPDWVTIVVGSRSRPDSPHPNWERDAEVIGYVYHPGGMGAGTDWEILTPEEVCHFAPVPDPISRFRGMSWLTPVMREIMGDTAAMTHKLKFFENGATPNMVVTMDNDEITSPEVFQKWVDVFEDNHVGMFNAYKTLYLGAGAKADVIGANMQQIDFKIVQGHGETRIAAASGVAPIIIGLSEGLEAATYSNYGQAKRRVADGTLRPLWRDAAASLARVVAVPSNAQLWYDDRDIPFLREDIRDEVEIFQAEATAARVLIDAGFKPDDAVKAAAGRDLETLLGKHTGLYSIQLQEPGSPKLPNPATPGAEGGAPDPAALPPGTKPAKKPPKPAKSANGNGTKPTTPAT
jgi:phage portal protein BeeE